MKKVKKRKPKIWREGTLGIPGLPVSGNKVSRLTGDTNPSWDDAVKILEDK